MPDRLARPGVLDVLMDAAIIVSSDLRVIAANTAARSLRLETQIGRALQEGRRLQASVRLRRRAGGHRWFDILRKPESFLGPDEAARVRTALLHAGADGSGWDFRVLPTAFPRARPSGDGPSPRSM